MLTDRGTDIAATPSTTNMSSTWRSRISTIRAPRPRARKRMASSSGSLDEFYRIAFRKTIYGSIADLQVDLDRWIQSYNEERPHQGRWCFGKTPMQTFLDATPLAKEKMIAA